MKFLLVAGFPDSLINFRWALLQSLISRGVNVHVAAPDLPPNSNVRNQLEVNGVVVHEIKMQRSGMNPISDLLTLLSLFRLMWRIRPDSVLCYTIKPVIYGSLAAFLTAVPKRFALITGLGQAFQSSQGKRSFLFYLVVILHKVALFRTTKVFFQNPDDRAFFRSNRIIRASQATVVVNGSGVDVDWFSQRPISGGARFILIARLLASKGIRDYVRAAEIVKNLHPEIQFSLVGWFDDGPDSVNPKELKAWVSSGTICFLGRLDDVRPAIEDATVFVLPSYYPEGTPRTVLEAMAMGRAIITTDAPGCRETVVDGENGFLVPVRDHVRLSEAMLKLVENPELIVKMGQRSRQIAEEKYDVHKVNAVMLREMGI